MTLWYRGNDTATCRRPPPPLQAAAAAAAHRANSTNRHLRHDNQKHKKNYLKKKKSSFLELLLHSLVVGQNGLAHEEKERRADRVERRHAPEEHSLQVEAPLLNQGAHQRGRQSSER